MGNGLTDPLTGSLSEADLLLQAKALEPLSTGAQAELERIMGLSRLDEWSEADVREEIITPILRVMGYAKESMFSTTREKSLRILEKGLSADYTITLWEEDFWVIEAKRPKVTNGRFKYDQLWQAVQYAIHPAVNAALVVLCDGHAIEIYDREESLEAPVLRVERENLLRDFDEIRALLGPLQSWFFQKRRVVRLLDKVFDKEFQLGRMEEFRSLVDRRLRAKEQQTIANHRALRATRGGDAELRRIRSADAAEIVEGVFPVPLPWPMIKAGTARLVELSTPSPFQVLHRIFPDEPRAANDAFVSHALHYLIGLSEAHAYLPWTPHWLGGTNGGGAPTDAVIGRLIALGLTHFSADPARKCVLLYANGVRRVFKALMVLHPQMKRAGETKHALQRYLGDEFDFSQMVSSPDRHLLLSLDQLEALALHRFVATSTGEHRRFLVESAKLELQQLWQLERSLISGVKDYRALLNERNLGEVHPTEAAGIVYDELGHNCLCILDRSPEWRSYALAQHRPEVEHLAAIGSWQARAWIGMSRDDGAQASEAELADRFFFGDVEVAAALRNSYGFR
ncbi:type I restriction enzyme HsdR N-terminal domain-containing protein [Belnapia sp. T6]|uniref:Type I restriction enzyme HsdR N-terminal domain-containing protein n=1 Tax=Belnapia mucosa TaxID=2804532 RepID=A0ABS1VBI6_9PROT|nr:type I restriction enzyme HsdR N-terminal domain-containing protein [Belnapia mucosa]MBL6459041.1 type I restriction enzyme HsdR N-terminal domain-containing protein [Belnapia mucosa]